MNRISNTKAFRRVGIAAVVGALVVAGAGIAGASTNTNARGVATSTLSARSANHHHGSTKVRPIEGWITSRVPDTGTPTSIGVTTHRNVVVMVTFLPGTVLSMGHVKLGLSNLAKGERVHVTAAPAPVSTTSNFVAATVTIQSTKVHPIDGVIYSLSSTNGTLTSMLVTTPKNGNVPVNFGAETVIANGGIVSSLTSASLIAGQHVHVILVPGLTLNAPPTALLVRVQSQS